MKNINDELYKAQYRVKSTRLSNWDYSSNGYYFITICTHNREHYFGKFDIVATQYLASLRMTEIGKTTQHCWLEIPNHFPFVKLDEFIIMPNHVHGILAIDHNDAAMNQNAIVETQNVETQNVETQHVEMQHVEMQHVETQNLASLRRKQNKFGPQSKNLASIIRGFKIGVKKYASMNDIVFAWQSGFYDHIIRNDNDLCRIREYITNNPANWDTDELFGNKNNVETQNVETQNVETQNVETQNLASLRMTEIGKVRI